jgi:hypothetical protein
MADEILEWRLLSIFFPHEKKRDAGRKENQSCCKFQGIEGHQCAETVSIKPVSHLVVVLGKNNKLRRRKMFRGIPVASLSKGRVLAAVDEAFPDGLGKLAELSKVLIIAVPFPGQQGMEAVVKIVVPLGIEVIPSF